MYRDRILSLRIPLSFSLSPCFFTDIVHRYIQKDNESILSVSYIFYNFPLQTTRKVDEKNLLLQLYYGWKRPPTVLIYLGGPY